jgi:hypothetical protein
MSLLRRFVGAGAWIEIDDRVRRPDADGGTFRAIRRTARGNEVDQHNHKDRAGPGDEGLWTTDETLWAKDERLWAKDEGLWTKDEGLWTKDEGLWTKDEGLWTKDERQGTHPSASSLSSASTVRA